MAYKPKYDITLDISVLGDKELDAQLRRLAGQGRSRIFGASARQAMKPVLRDVKRDTPVGEGTLQKAWRVGLIKAMSAKKSGGYVGARIMFPRRKTLGIPEDAKGYYPASLEFGFDHTSGKRIPAVMMVRKALYSNRVVVFNALKNELRTRIAKAMRKKGMSVPQGFDE